MKPSQIYKFVVTSLSNTINTDFFMQRDVHQLAKELLNMPEAPICVPTPEELRLYTMKHPDAVGPQIDPFVLDLASKGLSSPWNKRVSSIFATEFLSRKDYSCTD